jgi:TolA-binding protein
MRAASEHPRIAAAIAAALIVLALAGVGASRALGGSRPIRRTGDAQRVAGAQLAQLREQLQISQAQSAQLRGQVATLTTQLARVRQSQQRPATGIHPERRRAKH